MELKEAIDKIIATCRAQDDETCGACPLKDVCFPYFNGAPMFWEV